MTLQRMYNRTSTKARRKIWELDSIGYLEGLLSFLFSICQLHISTRSTLTLKLKTKLIVIKALLDCLLHTVICYSLQQRLSLHSFQLMFQKEAL